MFSLTVSVIVCTYNRADLLPGCLESLVAQTANKKDYEVIVVNNNSTDSTQEIAEAFAAREPNFRVVIEIAQGLSHARNRGFREARTEYVAYIDDDAKAEPDWIERALRIVEEQSPDIFGGSIYPFYLTEKPPWFKDAYEIRQTTERPMELKDKDYISGSNIFFRRPLLESVGGFDSNLGMKGKRLSYGEETAVIVQVRQSQPDALIFYHPNLRVKHLTPAEKMRVSYFLRSRFAVGWYFLSFMTEEGAGRVSATIRLYRTLISILFCLLRGIVSRSPAVYPHWQNYIVEEVAPMFIQLGLHCAVAFRSNSRNPESSSATPPRSTH